MTSSDTDYLKDFRTARIEPLWPDLRRAPHELKGPPLAGVRHGCEAYSDHWLKFWPCDGSPVLATGVQFSSRWNVEIERSVAAFARSQHAAAYKIADAYDLLEMGYSSNGPVAFRSCQMLRTIVSPFREFGLVGGALYAIDRVLRRVSAQCGLYVYEFMRQPVPDQPLLPERFAKGLEFREIKRGDPDVNMMPVRTEIKDARFRQNALCLGTYSKGELIGYVWFCWRAYEEDEVRCIYLLPDVDQSVFDFDLYVFPRHRSGIGFMAIWHGANQYLRSRGIRFTFSRVTRFNSASRRAHRHLGWKLVGRAVFLKLWHLEFMLATISPYVHLSLGMNRCARLCLRPGATLGRSSACDVVK